jgi:hypothetical protein
MSQRRHREATAYYGYYGMVKGEDYMSERDYLAKEEALRRLSEPEGDHELHATLERMRVDHPHLWGCSTGCTSHTMPTPPSSKSGEGLRRVAKSRSRLPTTTRPWASWRCGSVSFRKSG